MAIEIPLGPVMVDVAGTALTETERGRLRHPLVGGVILFARNYVSPEQLAALTAEIRALRSPPLLVAVDHEGGRVQRFQEGFTRIPPMRKLGTLYEREPALALNLARALGIVLGGELKGRGVDFSFTPVVDLDYGRSGVIGDRAFHHSPDVVGALSASLVEGLAAVGMGAVAKHFPGHGWAEADSHLAVPMDERPLADIEARDLVPYRVLVPKGLAGIMPAHVIYPQVDSRPAGFSKVWLQDILRGRLGFEGLVFSDDLSMEGAAVAGDVVARANAAFDAGCDMVLVCNAPAEADKLLAQLAPTALDARRAEGMRPPARRDGAYEAARATVHDAIRQGALA